MDIVKVINNYIMGDESSLGNAVEDAIIDLETVFKTYRMTLCLMF